MPAASDRGTCSTLAARSALPLLTLRNGETPTRQDLYHMDHFLNIKTYYPILFKLESAPLALMHLGSALRTHVQQHVAC